MSNFEGYPFGHGSFVQLDPNKIYSKKLNWVKGKKLEIVSYLKKTRDLNMVKVVTIGEKSESEPWDISADLLIPFETFEKTENNAMKIVETKFINITELYHHPKNHFIYGKEEDISDLIESLTTFGQTRPIIVNQNNEILSGNRRFQTAKAIGMTMMECEVREFDSHEGELEFLLIENVQRAKNTEQKVREAQLWKDIESAKAKKRQSTKGKDKDKSEFGTTRDVVAKKVGLGSGYNYQKAEKVVNAIDQFERSGDTGKVSALRDSLNKSVNRAIELLNEFNDPQPNSVTLINETIYDDGVEPEEFIKEIKSIEEKAEEAPPAQIENQINSNPNQYRFVGKASVWGINDGNKIELKPDSIVIISSADTNDNSQAIVVIPGDDTRFYIERTQLCLDSSKEEVEGIWRDRISLALANNPSPRIEAQFIRCHELTDFANLELSKKRMKKINMILADLAKDYMKRKDVDTHYETQLVTELKKEEEFQKPYLPPQKQKKDKKTDKKDANGDYFQSRTDAINNCKFKEGDSVQDKVSSVKGIVLSTHICEIGNIGDYSYFINCHVDWEDNTKSYISTWYLDKIADRPRSLIECRSDEQIVLWFDNLINAHPDTIKTQILALHSAYRTLKANQ